MIELLRGTGRGTRPRMRDLPRYDAFLVSVRRGEGIGPSGRPRREDLVPLALWAARLLALLAIIRVDRIVVVRNNDAGSVATCQQIAQNDGPNLLRLIPVLIVSQELVVQLGMVVFVTHAWLLPEHVGCCWGTFSVGDLYVFDILAFVTVFIGVSLALRYRMDVAGADSCRMPPLTDLPLSISSMTSRLSVVTLHGNLIVATFLLVVTVLPHAIETEW